MTFMINRFMKLFLINNFPYHPGNAFQVEIRFSSKILGVNT